MNPQIKISSAAARDAAAHSVSVLDPDGKVIRSTLPSRFASGADLLKTLHPTHRRMLATGEVSGAARYFLCTEDGACLLLTALSETHGVILAVDSAEAGGEGFRRLAAKYGFAELACKDGAVVSGIGNGAAALRFAPKLERRLSANGAPLTTRSRAEKFFNGFSSLVGVRAEIMRTVGRKTLFDGVDYKALGVAGLLVGLLASSLNNPEMLVSLDETDDRRSLKVEFEISVGAGAPDVQELEALFGRVLALKCKNLHVKYRGSSLFVSLCPTVFDPDAQGLMQGGRIFRTERRKK